MTQRPSRRLREHDDVDDVDKYSSLIFDISDRVASVISGTSVRDNKHTETRKLMGLLRIVNWRLH